MGKKRSGAIQRARKRLRDIYENGGAMAVLSQLDQEAAAANVAAARRADGREGGRVWAPADRFCRLSTFVKRQLIAANDATYEQAVDQLTREVAGVAASAVARRYAVPIDYARVREKA